MDIEKEIAAWKAELANKGGYSAKDTRELEDRLRDEMAQMTRAGLANGEALLMALRRMSADTYPCSDVTRQHCDRVWKKLRTLEKSMAVTQKQELLWVIVAALLAALLSKTPLLFGVGINDQGALVYALNAGLFVIPVLMAGCYALRRFPVNLSVILGGITLFAVAAMNLYPFTAASNTAMLAALHLPLLLWLALGLAYTRGAWRNVGPVWDYIRFTGEFAVYAAVLGLGGVVFIMLTTAFFAATGIDAEAFIMEYIGIPGLFAMPVVAAYLVEKKRSVVENITPMLARVFIPLFLAMTAAFIVATFTRLSILIQDRNALIVIDLLLALATGLVLYDLSARDTDNEQGFTGTDLLSLLLILAVLVIDVLAMSGIVSRLGQFGFSPNRTAALGENVLLFVNLAGLAYTYVQFALGRGDRRSMLKWHVWCLPAYFVWLALVVFVLPPLYRFM